MPEAVPGHPQPQPLTLKGMQFELSRVGGRLHRPDVCDPLSEHLHSSRDRTVCQPLHDGPARRPSCPAFFSHGGVPCAVDFVCGGT